MSSSRATVIGLGAIALWALLAFFTAASGKVPPFQLTAICFFIATLIGLFSMAIQGNGFQSLRQPLPVWLLGVGGLFGYHFFYFTALRNAPPVEAGLIAYLWPLLIILFSSLLPEERLRIHHVIGGLVGLAGAFLIVSKGGAFSFEEKHGLGYAAAGLCALIWSGYSVLSRRFANVPSEAVTGFCAASCALALLAHFLSETTIWPVSISQWLAIVCLGFGPVGLAFYIWDIGVKRGNIQVLGAASYSAPVLSTLVLVATGFAGFSWTIALAAALVTAGAIIAAKDMIIK